MDNISAFLSQFFTHSPSHSLLESSGQWVLMLFFSYIGGFLSSLTPCVYPMLPITLGIIVSDKTQSKKQTMLLAACYVLGMALVYASLGVFSALSGKIFGSLSNNTVLNLSLGVFLTATALFMTETFNINLTSFFRFLRFPQKNTLSFSSAPTLFLQSFLLGISSGFIAAPCTTPILTAILVFIADTRSLLLGFLLMFTFALGLGTLLFGLACTAGLLKILPRSGPWMQKIKIFGGILILAYAEYLIYKAGKGSF